MCDTLQELCGHSIPPLAGTSVASRDVALRWHGDMMKLACYRQTRHKRHAVGARNRTGAELDRVECHLVGSVRLYCLKIDNL